MDSASKSPFLTESVDIKTPLEEHDESPENEEDEHHHDHDENAHEDGEECQGDYNLKSEGRRKNPSDLLENGFVDIARIYGGSSLCC